MTHPNLQTNGASLEDCHTNFFALTELSGIKWRKLVWSDNNFNGDPLEDPILRGYARCLAADILCVWRRVATPQQSTSMYEIVPPPAPPPPLSLAASKELWIFWYGEEPDLMDLVAPELLKQDSDQGSQGSWESGLSYECRSLLFKALHNLIERCLLSRDFVRLGKWFVQPCGDTNEGHLSFSFAFFVHGESSVCASIDVRQHPPVRKVQRHHLQRAQASNQGIQVILAPFGLAGTLTGNSYKSTSAAGPEQGARLLDEWAQFYPIDRSVSAMTGSTAASTPAPSPSDSNGTAPTLDGGGPSAGCYGNIVEVIVGGVRMRYPACYVLITDMDQPNVASGPTANNTTTTTSSINKSAGSIPMTPPPSPPMQSTSSTMTTVPIDTRLSHPGPFAVSTVANTASMQHSPTASTVIPERVWQECMHAYTTGKEESEWEYSDPLRKVICTCSKCPASGSYTPTGAGGGAPRTQESLVIPSVGSPPGSVGAPSPLPNPRSAQPPSVPPIKEEIMPTLSPHETPMHEKPASGEAVDCGEAGEDTPKTPLPPRTPKTPKTPMKNDAKEVVVKALKRPILMPREDAPEEEDPNLNLLYDYSTMTAWINHPVKRYRGQEDANDSSKWRNVKNADLYEMYSQEIKVEPRDDPVSPSGGGKTMQGGGAKRPGDPYEFDEELDKKTSIKEEAGGAVKTSQDSLLTSEGLKVSYNDLDEIFDNQDEASPEVLQMATPPGSNKPLLPTGEEKKFFTTMLPPAEHLAQMFPTPPSLERPIASPQLEITTDLGGGIVVGPQIYPAMGSPREEHIEDWSFVFRPPLMCKMLGSSKYAPLTNLPSQNLPPVVLPTNCVYKPSWISREMQQREALLNTPATTNANTEEKRPCTTAMPSNAAELFLKNKDFFAEKPSPATSTATNSMEEAITPNPSANTIAPNPALGRVEVNSLLVNILLADTLLNIFRDHNFDSCTLCVCNAGPKVVGNIKGADALIYLPNASNNSGSGNFLDASGMPSDDDQIRCSCGFSAIINRRLAHKSGLFYEDEMEITGIAQDPALNVGNVSLVSSSENSIMELIREQCVVIQNSANAIFRLDTPREEAANVAAELNILEFTDGNDITTIVLDHYGDLRENIRSMCDFRGDFTRRSRETPRDGKNSIHRWPYLRARGPQCNQDIVRVMRCLQPLLQTAIQKKCQTRLWEPPSAVKGPLTWRQFHRLAGRGTDDRCEPQPIPSVIVGHEKEWLSLSPYALQHWEALLLEPYSYSRDIAFVVLCPDNEVIAKRTRRFFRELSSSYEMCKLGRHQAISKISREGIVRIKRAILPDTKSSETEDISSYASSCRNSLGFLSQLPMDNTLLDNSSPGKDDLLLEAGAAITVDKPATPLTPKASEEDIKDPDHSANSSFSTLPTTQISSTCATTLQSEEDEREIPAVVVYIVDPFTDTSAPSVSSCLSLLRNFDSVVQNLGEAHRANVSVQIISQESVIELGRARARRKRHADHMRSLALSVFSQSRRRLTHANSAGKTLTGFGTAATAELFLKNKDEKNRAAYKLYSPPYVLGPLKAKAENAESFGQPSDAASILYLSYCLSEDQSYLLAVATDEKGEIFETIAINVNIPNRQRRRRSLSLARRLGLQKLMDFVLGVISQSVKPWRLVVGRLGRIGHGELKGWSFLLSRKNLLAASKQIKEVCQQCSLMGQHVPSILSACLVSLEPDSTLRLMPDQFTPDERFSQISVNSHLNTPQDVTCTHILVFPTSATTQSSQTTFQEQNSIDPDDELFNINDLNDDMNEHFNEDFGDIFNWTDNGGAVTSPTGSPRRDDLMGSPSGLHVNQPSPFPSNSGTQRGELEEIGTVLQQPLALGYLVSTAPTGKMPRWFWASCPHLEGVCPAFLKNALHLHSPNVQQNSEEFLPQTAITSHALDSQYTTDVLRYVLEGYNALSWLALDDNTRDRLSCLPVHVQVLARLYHTTAAFL
ncbi:mediator of RNA polymerase II transcription subunit 13 isoform X2 [Atheta coriaria]|uniref:mediator of RNA polymerase II transcription subunit 13 isoform X2 n=1 Tax=Dalotia coriaria TaxID=877792 RepID=UPI0031F3E786